jgi:hypothetical protein
MADDLIDDNDAPRWPVPKPIPLADLKAAMAWAEQHSEPIEAWAKRVNAERGWVEGPPTAEGEYWVVTTDDPGGRVHHAIVEQGPLGAPVAEIVGPVGFKMGRPMATIRSHKAVTRPGPDPPHQP